MRLEKVYIDAMIAHALEEDPNECCGILAGKDGQVKKLYRMTNVEHSPFRYSWDPRELFRVYREIEDKGWEPIAVYHSHTHTQAYPSSTDIKGASWPEAYYLVISLMDKENPVVRAFRIVEGQVWEEPLEVF